MTGPFPPEAKTTTTTTDSTLRCIVSGCYVTFLSPVQSNSTQPKQSCMISSLPPLALPPGPFYPSLPPFSPIGAPITDALTHDSFTIQTSVGFRTPVWLSPLGPVSSRLAVYPQHVRRSPFAMPRLSHLVLLAACVCCAYGSLPPPLLFVCFSARSVFPCLFLCLLHAVLYLVTPRGPGSGKSRQAPCWVVGRRIRLCPFRRLVSPMQRLTWSTG